MIEASGYHGNWRVDPAHAPGDPANDVSLPDDVAIDPAVHVPRPSRRLQPWIGDRIERMPNAQLQEAAKHYMNSGPQAHGTFRRFAVTAHSTPNGQENDVSLWSDADLQALLVAQLGPTYPENGLQNRD